MLRHPHLLQTTAATLMPRGISDAEGTRAASTSKVQGCRILMI
jgi:hypothetical protein